MAEPAVSDDEATASLRMLIDAAPLTARTVAYAGQGAQQFAADYLFRNPNSHVHVVGQDFAARLDGGGVDLLVVETDRELAAFLQDSVSAQYAGLLLAGVGAGPTVEQRQALTDAGFQNLKTFKASDGEVWLAARKGPGWQSTLHVDLWAFAPLLMDIRTRLPIGHLKTDPFVTAEYRVGPFQLPALPLDAPKIVICQRPGPKAEAQLRDWLPRAIATGWVPVLESDDHPALTAGVHGREPSEEDWRLIRNMYGVQTSTPQLAECFAEHNPEVRVFPNAVFNLPPFVNKDRPRRVFYGAITRGPFAVEVARSLAPVVRQFPDVEFVVLGDRAVFNSLPTKRKRFEDYVSYDRYLALMAQCSVTLSPLAGRPYENTKSDAKFLDAARCGALMIASPTVYADVIQHGVNGLIAERRDHWAPLLSTALRNEPKRRQMAKRAWDHVREKRMFADQIGDRVAWYRDLWARRDVLEAALCDRLPGLADKIHSLRRA